MNGTVVGVHRSAAHGFHKASVSAIELIAGMGVDGDAHRGARVRHRSRVRADPTQPNLRQVHLIHRELFEEVAAHGFRVSAGELGENVTTEGLDLLGLPVGTVLRLGERALVGITGLRNPCRQIDAFQSGLLRAVVGRDAQGRVVLKAGVMGVVVLGGTVRPGDPIEVALPPPPHRALEKV